MSIELHCPKCQKMIRAPDNAGGKRGKCPYCKNAVYIPMPPDEAGEIPLAPIDEVEKQEIEKLKKESTQFAVAIDHAKEPAVDDDDTDVPAGGGEPAGEVFDFGAEVEDFVCAMRDSKLDEAEAAAARLKRSSTEARDYVQGLLLDELPRTYENVPPPVAKGFLKTLLDRLS